MKRGEKEGKERGKRKMKRKGRERGEKGMEKIRYIIAYRYSKEDDVDDMERDLGDEYGWKQVKTKYCTNGLLVILFI